MSEWQECNLGEIYEFASGLSKPRSEFGSGYPFLSFKDVFYNYFVPNRLESLVQTDEKERQRCSVRRGDVFLTRTSETMDELGMSCVALHHVPAATFNGFTKRLRPKREDVVLPEYAGYFFRSRGFREDVMSMTTMSTRASLNNEMLGRLKIKLPPVSMQSAIGNMLLALDNKIELNRRMNETLEAMARAIFKDWFVDFGPTRAKMAGSNPYLAPELWDLFPDVLDDEGKPLGWPRERIGDHVVAKKGLSYKGAGLTDEASGIPLHNLNSVLEGGGYKNDGLKFYLGDYKPRHIVHPGDLIVANTEQGFEHLLIGYSALVPGWAGKEGLFSHHIFKVQPRSTSSLSRVWLHYAMSASWFGESIRRFSNGTTVNMLPQDAFEIPEIIVPPSGLVRAFDNLVGPKLRKQEDSVSESYTLAQTRDLLLPKLMSGEIRLRDVERATEAVV